MSLARPSKEHLEWADCEIGVIIDHDLEVYDDTYEHLKPDNLPGPGVFNPSSLDTDQWLSTAAAAGANYAVLVAKHCSGFSLWPTQAHPFSVASSPWRNGKGDVVADFIRSCGKFKIRPGIYASCGNNDLFRIRDHQPAPNADVRQFAEYGRLVRRQYEHCRGKVSGSPCEREFFLDVENAEPVNMFSLMENIAEGETVSRYQICGFDGEFTTAYQQAESTSGPRGRVLPQRAQRPH